METILSERPHPGVLLVTLNRPAKRNALNVQMVTELGSLFAGAALDDETRCIVLTGDQKAFSAGADIADQHAHGTAVVFSPERLSAWDAIQNFPKPAIAAVNGYALGGGSELAMLCDVIIAGESAIFGQPEINLGIFPGDGATQRLPRRIGVGNALRYILTGARYSARRAYELGLVAEVVPDHETVQRALAVACEVASKSPIAARLAKAAIVEGLDLPLSAGLRLEREKLAMVFGSEGQKEGMATFVGKKPPLAG